MKKTAPDFDAMRDVLIERRLADYLTDEQYAADKAKIARAERAAKKREAARG